MTEKRKVPIKLLYNIFKTKFPISGIGLVFIPISIVSFIAISITIGLTKDNYEKYDYNKIATHGKVLTAEVTSVQTQYNVTVNNISHPQIIEYRYDENGNLKYDKFKTIVTDEKKGLKVGDSVSIRAYNEETVITDFKPYSFPLYLFYSMPAMFLLVGIIFILVGLIPTIKHYQLYSKGIKRKATILSMTPTSIIPFLPLRQNILVNYYYIGATGNKLVGTSISKGIYLLTEKKEQDDIDIFVSAGDESKSCIVPKEFG